MDSFDLSGMKIALAEAEKALLEGEVPVGAALFRGETLLWADHNRREIQKDPTAHAEILCLRNGAEKLGDWRLNECTLYVTLEPCPMCAGAIINARIGKLIYGAREENSGSCGSVINLFMENYGFSPQITGGVLADECASVLRRFFENRRNDG